AFSRELVADHRAESDACEAAAYFLERGFEARRIAGLDHALEAHLLDAREEAEALAVVGMRHGPDRSDLGHRFHEDDARDDRVTGEMPGLVPLLAGEGVLYHRADAGLKLGDAVYQQERVTVRDERLDRGFVERGHRERVERQSKGPPRGGPLR